MSKPLPVTDPAYWMLERGRAEAKATPEEFGWRSVPTAYNAHCYICRDPEFALMGLPVCYSCPVPVPTPLLMDGLPVFLPCGQHVAADDCECDRGHDVQGFYMEAERD